jgi:hypothetical protein
MVFGLGTRLSVNAFKQTIFREVPHLLIKTDSLLFGPVIELFVV